MKKITYRFECGEHTLLLRYGKREPLPKTGMGSLKSMKERYAEKWGVKPEEIKVTREVTEE